VNGFSDVVKGNIIGAKGFQMPEKVPNNAKNKLNIFII
jgi:hypothetical protein